MGIKLQTLSQHSNTEPQTPREPNSYLNKHEQTTIPEDFWREKFAPVLYPFDSNHRSSTGFGLLFGCFRFVSGWLQEFCCFCISLAMVVLSQSYLYQGPGNTSNVHTRAKRKGLRTTGPPPNTMQRTYT